MVYLGKVVGQGVVRPVRAKVLALDMYPPPTTKKELMRFLGMAGYYRKKTVVAPLTNLLKSTVKYDWSSQCQKAFENAKLLLTSAPVLAAPRQEQPFLLQVDASQVGAGPQWGRQAPLGARTNRKFNKHQLNYSTIEKEGLALVWALQHFDVYVEEGYILW